MSAGRGTRGHRLDRGVRRPSSVRSGSTGRDSCASTTGEQRRSSRPRREFDEERPRGIPDDLTPRGEFAGSLTGEQWPRSASNLAETLGRGRGTDHRSWTWFDCGAGIRVIGVGATLSGTVRPGEELGQGGMGTVYPATDQLLGRDVAIKLLKDSGAEEVLRRSRLEAQILARLVHDLSYGYTTSASRQGPRSWSWRRWTGRASRVVGANCCWTIGCGSADRWPRPRLCPCPGSDPPRHQTGQRPADTGRRREALGLRPVLLRRPKDRSGVIRGTPRDTAVGRHAEQVRSTIGPTCIPSG